MEPPGAAAPAAPRAGDRAALSPQQSGPHGPRGGERRAAAHGQRRAGSEAADRGGEAAEAAEAGRGWRGSSSVLCFSSSSDDEEFEMFLARLKTPKSVSKKAEASLKDFIDDSDDVFLDLKVQKSTTKNAQKDLRTPKKRMTPAKKNSCCQKLQYSEASSDTECSVFVESPWPGYRKQRVTDLKETGSCTELPPPQNPREPVSRGSPDLPVRRKASSCEKDVENEVPSAAPRQSREVESGSSDDEFESLIERIMKRFTPRQPVLSTSRTVYQPSATENMRPPCEDAQRLKGEGVKTPRPNSLLLQETPSRTVASGRTPRNDLVSCSQSAKTERKPRVCSVPGCFLQDLSNPSSDYVKYFKKNKEELAQKLFSLYNSTIFEQKLPEKMVIIWNKKMRKTAGYCVSGLTKGPEAKRYARIELSEKVCDSADRLRDTLVHELCHAATWLINGVRNGHGQFWRFYANKSVMIHPELPVVTRCHNYEINYKYTYVCVLCKATIGRHSKSLDTERCMCAFCGGELVLSQPVRKDGTPARTQLTPFAKYVKENYGLTKREQHGLSHTEVMRKLSADFALKTRLQDSL